MGIGMCKILVFLLFICVLTTRYLKILQAGPLTFTFFFSQTDHYFIRLCNAINMRRNTNRQNATDANDLRLSAEMHDNGPQHTPYTCLSSVLFVDVLPTLRCIPPPTVHSIKTSYFSLILNFQPSTPAGNFQIKKRH